ncbi:SRPBCC family protein [Nocardiopsis nanhaiensis]
MRIDNEFTVDAPVDRVWELFTDVEAIAPCMPGAQLTGVEGDVYSGKVKVKVGPVVAAYDGTAQFTEQDAAERRAVIQASGKASRGAGNASASVTLQLREEDGGTAVSVGTDLKITGKLAQLGGGMIKDVSERLLGQFVECLEGKLAAAPADAGTESGTMEADTERGTAEMAHSRNGQREEPKDGGTHMAGGGHMTGGGHMAGGDHMAGGAHMAGSGRLNSQPDRETDGPDGTGGEGSESGENTESAPSEQPAARREIHGAEAEPLDLGRASRGAVLQRLWPMLAVVVVVAGILIGYALFG